MKSEKEIIELYLKVNAGCNINALAAGAVSRHGSGHHVYDEVTASMLAFKDALAWVLGVESESTKKLVTNIEAAWDMFPEATKERFRKIGHIRIKP
jgi:Zn-dependent membrane protease YugP